MEDVSAFINDPKDKVDTSDTLCSPFRTTSLFSPSMFL